MIQFIVDSATCRHDDDSKSRASDHGEMMSPVGAKSATRGTGSHPPRHSLSVEVTGRGFAHLWTAWSWQGEGFPARRRHRHGFQNRFRLSLMSRWSIGAARVSGILIITASQDRPPLGDRSPIGARISKTPW